MLIVVVSPSFPRFDATTHYWQAEFASVVAFLRGRFPHARVVAVPAGLICAPDRVVISELLAQPDFLVLWSRVFEAPAAKQIANTTREISPRTKILVWGDGPLFMPQYFGREPFDGAVVGGDSELVLADAIERLAAGELPEHGMLVEAERRWLETGRGRWLDPEQWPFPDLDVIEFDDYRFARELRGKPTDDLSFDVSRGCHVGCVWCVDPMKGGRRDRRRPVVATVDFMTRGLGRYAQFQLHGPIFTQDRPWVDVFVAELRRRGVVVPFKAVTLVNHLAEERLVGELASVGMRAVGFGIETLTVDRSRRAVTPKVAERLLEEVARNLRERGVEGKAYTQVGLQAQRREDVLYTHRVLLDLGVTVRPTGATPFHLLRSKSVAELDQIDLTRWDRKSFFDPACGLSRREFFHLITSPSTFVADEVGPRKEVA
jgi:anaerobic magnesium-protoporphyrin IX monomethyl ester cyclase